MREKTFSVFVIMVRNIGGITGVTSNLRGAGNVPIRGKEEDLYSLTGLRCAVELISFGNLALYAYNRRCPGTNFQKELQITNSPLK